MKKIQFSFLSALVVGAASILASGIACADDVFVSNNGNNSIEEIVNGVPTTFVAPTSDLSGPTGIATYGGNIYVANNANNPIGGGFVAEFSLNGTFEGDVATGLNAPRGVVFDSFGNMYVSNQDGGTITEVPAGGGPAKTIVSGLAFAEALTFDNANNLYVTNYDSAIGGGNNIQKISLTDGVVNSITTFATMGVNDPIGITYDTVGANAGNFFVVQQSNQVVEFNLAGQIVPPNPFIQDLNTSDAADDIIVDTAGDFYVTDNGDNTVTEYNSLGEVLKVYNSPGAFDGPCYLTSLVVPEPSTYVLCIAGLGLLVFLRRRKAVTA